jgi:hypothetical protein
MKTISIIGAGAAAIGLAAPAAAQTAYPYQQQYPQTYQTYPGYQQGYPQGYGSQNAFGQIVDQLLGNRYNVSDRRAVSQCAAAAAAQAQYQYRGNGQQGYGQQGYGYQQGIAAPSMRVTAITSVERRTNGLRVRGVMNSGYGGHNGYNNGYNNNYQNRGYGGDLNFRCNVDYRGAVTNIRITPGNNYRRY